MDALDALLDGPRARGAFLLRAVLDPPWSLRVEDGSPLTVLAVTRGRAWVRPDGAPPCRLDAGDVALVRGPDHYTVAGGPGTPPEVAILPGQRCVHLADGRPLVEEWSRGVRTWGHPAGGTVLLVGVYERAGELSRPLLAALPPLVRLGHDGWDSPLVPLLAEEITRDAPGQRAVLDRLLDLVLVSALRTWLAGAGERAPAWYRARTDPVVGEALRLLAHNPAHPWTVARLATAVGVSRAALARRFTALVGEPPMTYLTDRRLALAADLLARDGATLGAVARQVGYATPFALSAAFKRRRGMSPRRYLERAGA